MKTHQKEKKTFEKLISIALSLVSFFHILTVDKGELKHIGMRSCSHKAQAAILKLVPPELSLS